MRLKNVLIVVKDMEKSINFYKDLFGLQVILNQEGNAVLTEGLVLQDMKHWKEALGGRECLPNHNMSELYFEERNIDKFVTKLKTYKDSIELVTPLTGFSWGQKIIRFYDFDGNLIEVRTPM